MSPAGLDFSKPSPRQRPLKVAPGTFLIRTITPSVGGTWTNQNSMVILAEEPIIVDTGMPTHSEEWFEDVFSLVSPEDVRWIFVTHIDIDHAGNLVEALERCPNARAISSHGESFRTNVAFGIPFEDMRLVDNDDEFDVGDRSLRAIRPPVYDSPYTRGVFDPTTGVYYSSDAFCAPMPEEPVDWVDEIPAAFWDEGMARYHHFTLCPWVSLVDPAKFNTEVESIAGLGVDVLVGTHTPAIRGSSVTQAFKQMAELPSAAPEPPQFAAATD